MSASRRRAADHGASRALESGSRRRWRDVRPSWLAVGSAAILLVGCGSSSHRPVADQPLRNDATTRVSATVKAQEQAIHRQVLASLRQAKDSTARYGGIPSFIPKASIPIDRVMTASLVHPALAIQGDAVQLRAPSGRALATAVGPNVPDRYQGSFHSDAPVTFDVSFTRVHGAIPIRSHMFLIRDELGTLLHPTLSVAGRGPVPLDVPTGRPFTLILRIRIPIGGGDLEYVPTGRHYLADWAFTAETD